MNLPHLLNIMIASFIFFPTQEYSALPKNFGLESEMVFILTKDGVRLSGWYLPAESEARHGRPAKESKGVIYFLHGNAGNISDRLFKAEVWVKKGFSVFLLDYRSYGKSGGKISGERDLYLDAEAGIRWLREEKKIQNTGIILYGESIGSALAIELGIQNSYWALILEAPFTSLAEIAKKHYPFVPTSLLSGFQFRNDEKISKLKSPVFIIHGTEDEICPSEMGRTLFEKAPAPKEFFAVPNGTHNELPFEAGEDFYNRPLQFLLKQKS